MRLVKPDWFGIDYKALAASLEGSCTYLNTFCILGEYSPSAIFKCASPNKAKGHQKYVLLSKSAGQWFIRGMSAQQMAKFRYQDAIHCLSCDDVIYSVMRHDMNRCTCGKVSIDGGKDYTRIGFDSKSPFQSVTIDLLTDVVTDSTSKLNAKVRKKKTKKN